MGWRIPLARRTTHPASERSRSCHHEFPLPLRGTIETPRISSIYDLKRSLSNIELLFDFFGRRMSRTNTSNSINPWAFLVGSTQHMGRVEVGECTRPQHFHSFTSDGGFALILQQRILQTHKGSTLWVVTLIRNEQSIRTALDFE